MTTICLLRGINVGGKRKVKMVRIVELFTQMGFERIRTYIQSGNLLFETASDDEALASTIESGLAVGLGWPVKVVLRSSAEWRAIIADNPFLADSRCDPSKLHVAFLDHPPADALRQQYAVGEIGGDEYRLRGSELYLYVPGGMARTKLTTAFIERRFGGSATVRSWRTVNKLAALGEE